MNLKFELRFSEEPLRPDKEKLKRKSGERLKKRTGGESMQRGFGSNWRTAFLTKPAGRSEGTIGTQ